MKTLLLVILFLLLNIHSSISGCICYYKEDSRVNLPINSCELYSKVIKKVFNYNCQFKPIPENKNNIINDDVVIFSGFGSPAGLFNSNDYDDFNKTIQWGYIASLGKKLLIVDACYSGQVRGYQTNSPYIITSSNSLCPSWNILYKNKWYSSASVTLACLILDDFDCPVPIPNILNVSNYYKYDTQLLLQTINIKILLKYFKDNYNIYSEIYVRKWENFCVGTINFIKKN